MEIRRGPRSPLWAHAWLCAVAFAGGALASPGVAAAEAGVQGGSAAEAGASRFDDGIDSPEMALAELIMGNRRFVLGKRTRSAETSNDGVVRARIAHGQEPFAVVVTCSDSRVPDNILFDQEAGRLFTVREAGNSPDAQGIASADYAIEHLGAKVVVVMGHTSCGAVKAVQGARGKPLPGSLWVFQSSMAGLLESTPQRAREDEGGYGARLVEANARRQAQALHDRSDVARRAVKGGKLWIVPAVYDLRSGQIRFLERIADGNVEAGAAHAAHGAAAHGPGKTPQTRR